MGDDIVGFITRGFGVSVHRRDCKNYIRSVSDPEEKDRWINVKWANTDSEKYTTAIHITAKERSGLVMDIAMVLNSANLKITSFNARDVGNGMSTATVVLGVRNSIELKSTMAKLNSIKGVTEVTRGQE